MQPPSLAATLNQLCLHHPFASRIAGRCLCLLKPGSHMLASLYSFCWPSSTEQHEHWLAGLRCARCHVEPAAGAQASPRGLLHQ